MRISISARIVTAGIISTAAFLAVRALPSAVIPRNAETMQRAARIMEQAIAAVGAARARSGPGIDTESDPNRTGLIGPELSPIITTLGELEAKRSTTNPNIAGFLVYLLDRAGVRPGDTIAIGSSGSFPALLVASLSAAKAMEVQPVTILSLGASSYGAGDPEFNLLDVYRILEEAKVCNGPPAAVSLGGSRDIGDDFDAAVREELIRKIRAAGIPLLRIPDLRENVLERRAIYRQAAHGKIAAFINSGGGYANLGATPLALKLQPGLNMNAALPPEGERGVLFEMAAQGVPVIHLLFIKGLVMQAGLPWDPVPLPKPGLPHPADAPHSAGYWTVVGLYFAALLLLGAGRIAS